jgi:tRNA 2-selenouridine synthase
VLGIGGDGEQRLGRHVEQQDYPHFARDPQGMVRKLEPLKPLVGNETLTHWMALATEGRVDELFESVMVLHYDPCYRRSTKRNYGPRPAAMDLALDSLEPAGLEEAVRRLIELDARESIAAPVVSQ